MKKLFSIFFLLVSITVSAQLDKIIANRPNPPKLVNDFSGSLTREQAQALEQKLVAYNDSTSTQIAVVLVSSLDGASLEDAALSILRNWGVGGKENNNGVVILAAINDRKITIQTGYGLEGALPDVTAKSIIDNSIKPSFQAGNYYRGLDLATDDIFRAAAGLYKAPAGYGKSIGKKGIGSFAIIIFIIFLVVSSRGGGRGGGGMVSRRGYRDFGAGWILGSILSGGGGGGWSGGGGGGGGGFGGFGGGSGGGGGASGSW